MTILIILKFLHLAALVAGLGAVALADLAILRGAILRPVNKVLLARLQLLARVAGPALALLWITGVGLVLVNYAADASVLGNGKLWAKVAVVALLTLNGLAVHRVVMPYLEARNGQHLFDIGTLRALFAVSAVAAVSIVSWQTAAVLGLAREMNFAVPAATILWSYAWLLLAAWLGLMIVCVLTMKDRQTTARAESQTIALFGRNATLRRRMQQVAARETYRQAA